MLNENLIDAQVAIIGSILIEPDFVSEIISSVHEDDFITSEYKNLFLAAKELFLSNKPVDAVTVCNKVGEEYRKILMQIIEITPTAAAWAEYSEILKKESQLYKLRNMGNLLKISKSLEDAYFILEQAQKICVSRKINATSAKEGFLHFLSSLDEKPDYVKTNLRDLDRKLKLSKGDFLIIGGYPSSGKTALAIQISSYMARFKKVGFFSFETNDRKIYERLICQNNFINFSNLKNRTLKEKEVNDILENRNKIINLKFDCINAAGMTVNDIKSQTLAGRYEIIIIDYIQLIKPSSAHNRTEQVSQISRELHTLAQQHQVLIIGLSQLSRPEKDQKVLKAPTMASLRESGQLEQDADAVILLYLSEPENPYSDRILKLAKNKDGELAYMQIAFDGKHQSFLEYME